MKKTLKIIGLIFVFYSCDDKIKSLENLNEEPTITYLNNFDNQWVTINKNKSIYDTAKIYSSDNNLVYKLAVRLDDINNNYSYLDIFSYNNENEIWVNDEFYYNTISVDTDSFSFAYKNADLGDKRISFDIFDDFDKSINFDLNIRYVDNENPIAELEVNLLNNLTTNEYELNGSNSFDKDERFGGFIKEYQFIIDNVIINTSENKINHVFTQGEHTIKLRVKDNDDVYSVTTQQTLNVL